MLRLSFTLYIFASTGQPTDVLKVSNLPRSMTKEELRSEIMSRKGFSLLSVELDAQRRGGFLTFRNDSGNLYLLYTCTSFKLR